MISSVRGTVLSCIGTTAIIEVGGVGLSIQVTPEHALTLRVGDQAFIHTSLIVREDALSLFGFESAEQLEIFHLLLSVNGVGPKSALGVLSVLGPGQVAAAVEADDDKPFKKVSGIGPKTAKLIVVSLSGKVAGLATSEAKPQVEAKESGAEVVSALTGLGWSERIAEQTVSDIITAQPDMVDAPLQMLLRLALAQLGPAKASGSKK